MAKKKITVTVVATDNLAEKLEAARRRIPEHQRMAARREAERMYEEITEHYRRFLRGEKP